MPLAGPRCVIVRMRLVVPAVSRVAGRAILQEGLCLALFKRPSSDPTTTGFGYTRTIRTAAGLPGDRYFGMTPSPFPRSRASEFPYGSVYRIDGLTRGLMPE